MAAWLDFAVASNFWDLDGFFDRIEVGELAQKLLSLGCPAWALAIFLPVHVAPR